MAAPQQGSSESSKSLPGDIPYDIIGVGFGPAALAIAIAMRDRGISARVLFLERQPEFGWHTGMLLPGSRMQISFLKDLATMRNPTSPFTFLNYLHKQNRLTHFVNLSTHTPLRQEFNAYMRWCASHFDDLVQYNQEVLKVTAIGDISHRPIDRFAVHVRDVRTGELRQLFAKHVIVATGGEKAIPPCLQGQNPGDRVIHSSEYLHTVGVKLPDETASYRVAVVGGGQSGVEIVEDVRSRYPKSQVSLFFRDSALRPSDDSPFVNEIFDPSSVDIFYQSSRAVRQQTLKDNKATNYGVVRLNLLEGLYEKLYEQKINDPDPSNWPLRLFSNHEVCGIEDAGNLKVKLKTKNRLTGVTSTTRDTYDLVVLATGYQRDPVSGILSNLKPLLSRSDSGEEFHVQRDYRLTFRPGVVRDDAGIWLQGSCESTHGISDSLLSILAVRSAEILDSILASLKSSEFRARL
ncbi:hypothetical protein VTN49DRAFT_6991 [Thermomyces lanuginosus]|uniref:uncharacterized protein n=1 Tax=Thermomyces lanuginosus TaxID=5541 RepID=UPI0037422981